MLVVPLIFLPVLSLILVLFLFLISPAQVSSALILALSLPVLLLIVFPVPPFSFFQLLLPVVFYILYNLLFPIENN